MAIDESIVPRTLGSSFNEEPHLCCLTVQLHNFPKN